MTAPTISLQELEARLWKAANALRGPVDPADFKTYVFPMLFYKWLSDTHAWEREQAIGDFGDGLTDEIAADYHRFTLPPKTHWSEVTIATANLGAGIARALGKIEQANPDKLAGIFGDAAWGNKERLPESALVALINAFNGLTLNPDRVPNDLLGQAYEYLLKNFADASGSKAGEFFTPREVVHLLVRILEPKPGESVYDPAAGSGGMLVDTINSVKERGGDARTLRLYGQEVNLTTSAIAKMNLFLHDIEEFKIVRGDTLGNPLLKQPNGALATFDVVIANPPFSLSNWAHATWAQDPRSIGGVPPKTKADFAWIQHMIASMRPDTGRVGVVMPHGVLFRAGTEAAIRQHLVETDLLEAVIGLPNNLFYSTTIPAALLIFRRAKRPELAKHVLFVDASARFEKGRNQNRLTNEDVDAIHTAYTSGAEGESLPVRAVPLAEIATTGFDLNIGRYLRSAAEDSMDVATALALFREAQEALRDAEAALDERLKVAGYA